MKSKYNLIKFLSQQSLKFFNFIVAAAQTAKSKHRRPQTGHSHRQINKSRQVPATHTIARGHGCRYIHIDTEYLADVGWPRQMCLRLSLLGLCGSRFVEMGGLWVFQGEKWGKRVKLVAGLASVNILVTHTYSLHLSGPLDPRN